MKRPLPPPRRPRAPRQVQVIPGLGADSLAGLTPEAAAARSKAADERQSAVNRRFKGRQLADRVEALPPVKLQPAAPTPAPVPEPLERKPWRDKPLVVKIPKTTTEPSITPEERAALKRLMAAIEKTSQPPRHRYADRQTY